MAYWYVRPNRARVNTNVVVDSWDIANDGQHNSNDQEHQPEDHRDQAPSQADNPGDQIPDGCEWP